MAVSSKEFLSENDTETVWLCFFCYDYGANTSAAVDKIAINQKNYHKCSLCFRVCSTGKKNHHNKKDWLLGQFWRS